MVFPRAGRRGSGSFEGACKGCSRRIGRRRSRSETRNSRLSDRRGRIFPGAGGEPAQPMSHMAWVQVRMTSCRSRSTLSLRRGRECRRQRRGRALCGEAASGNDGDAGWIGLIFGRLVPERRTTLSTNGDGGWRLSRRRALEGERRSAMSFGMSPHSRRDSDSGVMRIQVLRWFRGWVLWLPPFAGQRMGHPFSCLIEKPQVLRLRSLRSLRSG